MTNQDYWEESRLDFSLTGNPGSASPDTIISVVHMIIYIGDPGPFAQDTLCFWSIWFRYYFF